SITFLKDTITEEYLKTQNINERQIKALLYIKKYGQITNKIYQAINSISKPSATLDLRDLLNRNFISRTGTTGRGTFYVIKAKG
ncbi:MAG: transcriptional regulator, partial [Mangrovibacterium sp.]|nr:transcriptional regulator [Mangrovibacterium sp.]